MTIPNAVAAFLRFYPQIYFACHRRHVRDQQTRRTLSLNQARILDHLDAVAPTHLHSLARHMGVTASTMSLNVDRLEKAGYVRRQRDHGDARRIELRLTETGERLKQQQHVLDSGIVAALLKRLKPQDRVAAIRSLQILAAAGNDLVADWQKSKHQTQLTHSKRERNSQ